MITIDIKVSLDQLLVDPNNYRLDDGKNHENILDKDVERLQAETLDKLKFQRLGALKNLIITNGFLEIERIVVRELNTSSKYKKYVVVEGNRRTATLKNIKRSYDKGEYSPEDLPENLIENMMSINVVLVKGTTEEIKKYTAMIMGVRHVSGPKKWSGYQSAKLINDEYDDGKSFSEIGELLGITAIDAGRRYRGYRAFKQMVDEGYEPKKNYYTLMLEFLAAKKAGREWLEWDDNEMGFKNKTNRERLYLAIAGNADRDPEITSPNLARDFLECISSKDHREKIEQGILLKEVMLLPFNSDDKNDTNHRLSEIENYFQCFDWLSLNKDEEELILKIYKTLTVKLKDHKS